MVIIVSPATGPLDGLTESTVGRSVKTSLLLAALVPLAVVTNTLHRPTLAPLTAVAVISVEDCTTTLVAAMVLAQPLKPRPTATVAPATKPVPVMVMGVPVEAAPDDGLTEVTVGTMVRTVKLAVVDAEPSVPVTV